MRDGTYPALKECVDPEKTSFFSLSNDNDSYFNHLCWKNHHKEMICCLKPLGCIFLVNNHHMLHCIFDMTALLIYKYSHNTYTRHCTTHWTNMNLFSAHSRAPTHKEGTALLMMLPGTVRSSGQFKVTERERSRARLQTQSSLCP